MVRHVFPPLAALALTATALSASGASDAPKEGTGYLGNGVFTYEIFETSIAHADLEGCPAEFDPEAVFCRLTLAQEQAHVFVFAFSGEQPLLAVKSYDLGDGFLPF